MVTALDAIKGTAAEREINQRELELARHYTAQFISQGEIHGADDWNALLGRLAGL